MHPILRNILSVIAGIIVGSLVNMAIIKISGSVIPPPEGADLTTPEGLKASMHLMQPKHFIMPFLAHALGTFAGALTTAFIAVRRRLSLAMVIGVFFLLGGITAAFMIPTPSWFIVVDLLFAYIPMSYLAGRMVVR